MRSLIRQFVKLQSWKNFTVRTEDFIHNRKIACRYYCKTTSIDADPAKALGYACEWKFSYTAQDAILYALAVGTSTRQPDFLKFLFEEAHNFCVLPSYALISAQRGFLAPVLEGKLPGLEDVDPAKALHGEQYLEIHRPMPRSGCLKNECTIVDVLDKRSGALLLFDVHTYDNDSSELIAFNQFSVFFVGAGGFGGQKGSELEKRTVRVPSRPAEHTISQATSVDQAALYRLCGDDNPLHVDPAVAQRVGFPKPILHGLCTLGFGVRHVLQQYANYDVTKFKAVKVRFSKPLFPGQTIKTSMWRDDNRVHFQCDVEETGDIVISGAYVDFHDID